MALTAPVIDRASCVYSSYSGIKQPKVLQSSFFLEDDCKKIMGHVSISCFWLLFFTLFLLLFIVVPAYILFILS